MRPLLREPPLVGREEELDLLQTAGELRSTVIGGAAGVGKSRLLAELLGWWRGRGATVVHVRATSSTASIPFGAFARWIPATVGISADRLEILRAVAVTMAPPGQLVAVGVDDAHLLDEGGAALCLELAQRGDARLTVSVRTGEPAPDAVTALWKEALAERIDLQPLAEADTFQLLGAMLGDDISDDLRARVWHLTEGVPLYVREVIAAGLERDVIRSHGQRWDWDGDLPGSDRLRSLIFGRVQRFDPAGRRALTLLALGEPLDLAVLSALTDSPTLQALEAAGQVIVDARADGVTARLSHPLYGEVIRAAMPVTTRRQAFAELVEATRRADLAERDLQRMAAWHLESDQDPDVELLLAAFERAFVVDDWAVADRLARAAEAAGGGAPATVILAMSLATLGRWDEAEARLASVDPSALDDELALRWVTIRAWVDFFHREDHRSARAALASVQARGGPTAAGAAAQAAHLALFMTDLPEIDRQVARVRSIEDAGEAATILAEVSEAMRLTFRCEREAARTLIDASMNAAFALINTDASVPAVLSFANLYGLVLDGHFDGAAAFADGLHALTGGQLPSMRALWQTYVAYAELFRGNPARALTLAQEATHGHGDRETFALRLWTAGAVVWAAAQIGDVETAEAALAGTAGRWPTVRIYHLQIDLAAAWLADALGQSTRAQAKVAAVVAAAHERGLVLIELLALHDLVRLGAPQITRRRLREIANLDTSPYAGAAADHADAAAACDGAALDAVGERFETMGTRLIAAEAHAQAAAAHRRAGRHGSELTSIAAARRLSDACPGARTAALRSLDDTSLFAHLTAREREVIDLAARHLTNRQIAAELYISVRTVTTHLQRAYAKLGLNDRTQLAQLGRNEQR